MKSTTSKKSELEDYLVKIVNFAKAINLDEDNVSADGIALTMADEIQTYGTKALDLVMDKTN